MIIYVTLLYSMVQGCVCGRAPTVDNQHQDFEDGNVAAHIVYIIYFIYEYSTTPL